MASVGWGLVMLVVLANVMNIGTDLGSNIWLALWSEDTALEAANLSFTDPSIRVGVYAALGMSTSTLLHYLDKEMELYNDPFIYLYFTANY